MIVLISAEMISARLSDRHELSSNETFRARSSDGDQLRLLAAATLITAANGLAAAICVIRLENKSTIRTLNVIIFYRTYFALYCFWLFFLALPICSSLHVFRRVFWHWNRSISLTALAAVEARHYQKKKTRHFNVVCVMSFNTLVNKISEA